MPRAPYPIQLTQTRRRLCSMEKPILVKSLKNGAWYCALKIGQCWGHVIASSGDVAKGATPIEAYRKWLSRFRYLHMRPPAYLKRGAK